MTSKNMAIEEKKIEYRLKEIHKLSYFENNPSEYHLTVQDIQIADVKIGIKFTVDEEHEQISLYTQIIFVHPKDRENYKLFGIETLYVFAIKSFTKQFHAQKDGVYNLPDNLLLTFLSLAISGTRGMLAVLNTNPSYKHILLPVIDPLQLLKTLNSKNVKSEDSQ